MKDVLLNLKRNRGLFEIIKSYYLKENAKKWILKRIAPLGEKVFFVINNKFKKLKYEYLREIGNTVGGFSPYENEIHLYGKKHIGIDTVLHETLHAASCNLHKFSEYMKNFSTDGLMGRYNSLIKKGNYHSFVQTEFGKAINEGATEFFTYDILKEHGIEREKNGAYFDLLNIFAVLCSKVENGKTVIDDEKKNDIFKYYINSDFNGFVDYLCKIYNSPKSQVMSLVFQMDRYLSFCERSYGFICHDMLTRCYNTLYDLEFNRFLKSNPNGSIEEFLKSDFAKEIFDIIPNKDTYNAKLEACALFMDRSKNYKTPRKDSNNFDNFVLNSLFAKKYDHKEIKSNSFLNDLTKSYLEDYNENYDGYLKGFSDNEKVNLFLFYCNSDYLNNEKYSAIIAKNEITKLLKTAMPKNKNYKNDLMFYVLNIPSLKYMQLYKNFTNDEILDYVKSDNERFIINIENIFSTPDLKEYVETSKKFNNEFKVFGKELTSKDNSL